MVDNVRVHCFLLTLPLEVNLQRIDRRRAARAIDDREFELAVVKEERAALSGAGVGGLGEPLDVSAPPEQLVETVLARLECSA
jgi:hypothetical protein